MLGIFLQLLVSGIAMGFVYGLVGIEYTLIWNSTGLLNFAHERIIMLGAYVLAGTFVMQLGMAPLPGIVGVIIFITLFAILVALAVFIPLRNMSRMCAIMATVMLGNIINEGVRLYYGPEAMTVKGFLSGVIRFNGMVIAKGYVAIIIVALLILTLLTLFMKKTKTGKAMRCVASNKNAASLMGISVNRTITLTFAIGSALAAFASIFYGMSYVYIKPTTGAMPGIKAFTAAVFGGIGSIPGAMLGGILLGMIEQFSKTYISTLWADAIVFGVLVLVLVVKPTGLLGKNINEKV